MSNSELIAEAHEYLRKMASHTDCCGTSVVRALVKALEAKAPVPGEDESCPKCQNKFGCLSTTSGPWLWQCNSCGHEVDVSPTPAVPPYYAQQPREIREKAEAHLTRMFTGVAAKTRDQWASPSTMEALWNSLGLPERLRGK